MAGGGGPRRTCVGCRRTTHPDDLVRVVRTDDAGLVVGRHLPGRGAWICRDPACVALALRRRAFPRALRGEVRPEAVAALDVAITA
ncbi:YlxR family protein [Iamia majanohamensis]|uniref:YlxR family protein n=1 Tax=Iamia majanohamensis TaxID=467976 RepID=A0AAF0BU09_9ACTN|nr:YlxR family protein [Iamia majanohamensis]WCO65410.1 YlxR family protein [Iamia majanohamensis]